MTLYALCAFLAITYLGEHYLVDVIAGVALSAFCYFLAYRWSRLRGLAERGASTIGQAQPAGFAWMVSDSWTRTRILLMVMLLALGQSIGLWAKDYHWRYKPSASFIERELDGQSTAANFHRGRNAFEREDFSEAQEKLAVALNEVTRPGNHGMARFLLGMSALRNEDTATAVENLGQIPLPVLGPQAGLMLAQAQLTEGQRETGFETLDGLTKYFGTVPEFIAAKAEIEYRSGRIDAEEYRARLAGLAGNAAAP